MTYSTPYFKAYKGVGTSTEIPNIQTMTFGKGRRYVTDNYRSGAGTLTGRRPDLLPSLAVGDTVQLDIGVDGVKYAALLYRVSNLRIDYGIVSSMDTWTIDLEDAFAILGRAQVTQSWSAGDNAYTVFTNICTAANCGSFGSASSKTVSAQSFTNANALQLAQTVANTSQAYLYALDAQVNWYNSDWPYTAGSVAFSDAGTAGTLRYDNLTFGSLVDNYATKVVVTAAGLGDSTSGTGNLSYSFDTYSSSASDATAVAQFTAGNLSANTASPLQISGTIKEQSIPDMFYCLGNPYLVTVVFRGSTYNTYILGWQISGTPQDIRCTYFLASSSFFSQFILNSTTSGVLNTNKLGF